MTTLNIEGNIITNALDLHDYLEAKRLMPCYRPPASDLGYCLCGTVWNIEEMAKLRFTHGACPDCGEMATAVERGVMVQATSETDEPQCDHLIAALASFESSMKIIGGCPDGYCLISGKAKGMHTNGGCRCWRNKYDAFQAMSAGRRLANRVRAIIEASTLSQDEKPALAGADADPRDGEPA